MTYKLTDAEKLEVRLIYEQRNIPPVPVKKGVK